MTKTKKKGLNEPGSKPSKVEFITRLEAAKEKLPNGLIPLYMTRYPEANRGRVSNTVGGKIQDLKILKNIENLVELITRS